MAGKTVDDLKELRASLVQLRRKEAYLLSDDPSTGRFCADLRRPKAARRSFDDLVGARPSCQRSAWCM
jgi:hypothetical protein